MAISENIRIFVRNLIFSPCVCVAKILCVLMQWFNVGYDQAPKEQDHSIGKYMYMYMYIYVTKLPQNYMYGCARAAQSSLDLSLKFATIFSHNR